MKFTMTRDAKAGYKESTNVRVAAKTSPPSGPRIMDRSGLNGQTMARWMGSVTAHWWLHVGIAEHCKAIPSSTSLGSVSGAAHIAIGFRSSRSCAVKSIPTVALRGILYTCVGIVPSTSRAICDTRGLGHRGTAGVSRSPQGTAAGSFPLDM